MDEVIEKKIGDFFGSFAPRSYPKGQILILNGDEVSHVYHLIKGTVKEYDITYRGEEITLNVFKPPSFFPMSLAINKMPSPYIYEAESPVELHRVPASEVLAFINANPDVMLDLLSRVYKGTDGLIGRLAQLMAGSARSRLIYEIIVECDRFGEKQPDGSVILVANESELASRAGLSRETVSREMHGLKDEGLVQLTNKEITAPDLPALKRKLKRD